MTASLPCSQPRRPAMRAMEIFSREPDVRIFSAGQPIFAEGEPGDVMYAVLQGEVEIRRAGRVLGTVRDGGIFGEMAILDEKPRSAAAVADRKSTRLNSSHSQISYAVFCLKKKNKTKHWRWDSARN